MLQRSILILAVVVIGVVAASFTFFSRPNCKKQSEIALQHLSKNDFKEAEAILNSLPAKNGHFPVTLYRGYLSQLRGRYKEADLFFQTSLKSSLKEPKEKEFLIQEIASAQMIAAYLEKKDFSSLLAVHPITDPLYPFFEGLNFYLQAQYAEALNAWRFFTLPPLKEGSGWRSFIFENYFPQNLRNIHLAHCLIETGEILKAREILEKEGRLSLENQKSPSLSNLFLGLTYLKEAQKIPLDQRASYYKLANFYFEKASSLDPYGLPSKDFFQEKTKVSDHIQKEIKALLFTHATVESKKWAFDLIKTIVSWDADPAIEEISSMIAKKILKQKNLALCACIKKDFIGTSFHTKVSEKVLEALACDLKKGEIDDLFVTFSTVEPLFYAPQEYAKKLVMLSSEEIFEIIKRDDAHLIRFQRFLTFWETLDRSPEEKFLFANELFFNAKLFWQKEGQEKKGLRLMDLACNLSSKVRPEIEFFLTAIYNDAESSNMIGRLAFIYDALEHFQIIRKEMVSPTKLANHLADAEYLYQSRNFLAAQSHATWVLKIDSRNEQAMRLMGLSSYQLGEFAKAAIALQMLSNPDENAKKALLLSEAFASQQENKHLVQIDTLNSLKEDE